MFFRKFLDMNENKYLIYLDFQRNLFKPKQEARKYRFRYAYASLYDAHRILQIQASTPI